MIFKTIPEFPNYAVREDGKILSCYKPKTNIPTKNWRILIEVYDKSCGYKIVTLCHKGMRRNKKVHRLYAEMYIPNPFSKKHVNHKNGDKLDNSLSNLEWATPAENSQHAMDTGLSSKVLEATRTKVTQYSKDKTILIFEHESIHEAGRSTGVAWQNISKVCRGLRHTAGGFHWKYKNV